MKKLITYIFPIYNETESLDKLHEVLMAELKKVEDKYDFEIICVNDGSKDDSLEKLLKIREMDKRFKIVNFSRNYGQQMAVTAGLDYAKGDAVIIMDADLQDPPRVSLELIQKWEEGYEVVYAVRRTRQDSFFKKATAFAFYRTLAALAEINIPKDTGDFRLMDRKAVDAFKQFRETNRFNRGLVAYIGFKQYGHLFDRDERFAGEGKYPLKKLLSLAADGITSFSTTPLKWVGQFGVLIFILGILLLGAILARYLTVGQQLYFSNSILASIIIIATGLNLIFMNFVAMYVGKIFTETQHRPLYLVSQVFE